MDLRLFLLGAISCSDLCHRRAVDDRKPNSAVNAFAFAATCAKLVRPITHSVAPFDFALDTAYGTSLARADGPAERLPVARTFSRPDARTDGPAERVPVARADAPSDATTIDSPERMPVDHANIHAHHFAVCCADFSTNTTPERDSFEHSLANSQRDTVHAADLDAVPPPHRDSIDGPIPRANFGSFCEPDVDADDRADQRTI
ncbi:hypothetical protein CTAYLR_006234 [Chrysophaeum taylorii]|uniref:Uncharacterized protein n=1 Tax=Chrysophaeum taylorii TaxID=2483200 RepID=A0AAD7UJK4_9STRA|nr:hypothetical protein CTAYLR_006234 [Chrysophaeum taylorii]